MDQIQRPTKLLLAKNAQIQIAISRNKTTVAYWTQQRTKYEERLNCILIEEFALAVQALPGAGDRSILVAAAVAPSP